MNYFLSDSVYKLEIQAYLMRDLISCIFYDVILGNRMNDKGKTP